MTDDLVKRLREPPFGTETSERNLMASAADAIERLTAEREAREKAEAALNREVDWRMTAIRIAKGVARADALREAAAPYGQNPTALFAGASVEATLLRLIDKEPTPRVITDDEMMDCYQFGTVPKEPEREP